MAKDMTPEQQAKVDDLKAFGENARRSAQAGLITEGRADLLIVEEILDVAAHFDS